MLWRRPRLLFSQGSLAFLFLSKNHSRQFSLQKTTVLNGGGASCIRTIITMETTTQAAMSSSSQKEGTAISVSAAPAFPWCCTASLCRDGDATIIQISKIAGYGVSHDTPFCRNIQNQQQFDLTQSSDWMEWVEHLEDRMQEEGGAGAYDTMRCDMILHSKKEDDTKKWIVWGQDFHLERLMRSYRSLLAMNHHSSSNDNEERIQQALATSKKVLAKLLDETEHSELLQKNDEKRTFSWKAVKINLIRLTLLWTPPREPEQDIIVRGHACSSASVIQVHQPVKPIVATLTASTTHINANDDSTTTPSSNDQLKIDESIPSRFSQDPHAKVASWTRLRKQMEQPDTYKPPGVSEVLMVRPIKGNSNNGGSSNLEVLEGLSSNFFVIYKDQTLRTAQEGVLDGYVRHLILDQSLCEGCGVRLDPTRPILLNDARKGLWKEAFITSSSRLIYPISKILVRSENGTEFEEFWSDPLLTSSSPEHSQSTWRKLLDEILKKGGYP